MIAMGIQSASTSQSCGGTIKGDDGCLFTSFRVVNGIVKSITNGRVKDLVVEHILKHETLESLAVKTDGNYETVKDYSKAIKKNKFHGGKIEVQALAMISKLTIRVLSMKSAAGNTGRIEVSEYGYTSDPFKECVYMFYDEEKKHYAPLYIIFTDGSEPMKTIFERDDQAISELFVEFIREKRHGEKEN